jgi:hypothetical protein
MTGLQTAAEKIGAVFPASTFNAPAINFVQPTSAPLMVPRISTGAEVLQNPQVRRKLTLDDHQFHDLVVERLKQDLVKNPDDAQAHYNLGAWLLSAGKLTDEAWEHLSWRLFLEGVSGDYTLFPIPVWDGEDITGKNIFVWLEQGIGDQIQVASMFNDAIAKCASVSVYCNRRVAPLFKRSFPGATILKPGDLGDDFRKYDFQLTFGDLGQWCRKSFASFPKHKGYLKADPARAAELRAKYKAGSNKPLVGLSWYSSNAKIGEGKSLDLLTLAHNVLHPGANFVSLQYDDASQWLYQDRIVRDSDINQMWDMEGFAAQVAAMDRVISISNTALHVAGALGVKALGLLSRGGCRNWYWFNERTDSPWYPSVELIRQTEPGNWDAPLKRAGEFAHG